MRAPIVRSACDAVPKRRRIKGANLVVSAKQKLYLGSPSLAPLPHGESPPLQHYQSLRHRADLFGPERAVQNSPPRGPRRGVKVTKLFVSFIPLNLCAIGGTLELIPAHFEEKHWRSSAYGHPYTA